MLILPPLPCPGPREWVMYRRGASPPERKKAPPVPRTSDPSPPAFSFGDYGWITWGMGSGSLQMGCDLLS